MGTQAALAGASLWVATGLAVAAAAARGDFVFALTAAWALTAIRVDGAQANERSPDRYVAAGLASLPPKLLLLADTTRSEPNPGKRGGRGCVARW